MWQAEIPAYLETLDLDKAKEVYDLFYVNDPLPDPVVLDMKSRNTYILLQVIDDLIHLYHQIADVLQSIINNNTNHSVLCVYIYKLYELYITGDLKTREIFIDEKYTIVPLKTDPFSLGVPFIGAPKWIPIESSPVVQFDIDWDTSLFNELHIDFLPPITVEIDFEKTLITPKHFYKYKNCLKYIFEKPLGLDITKVTFHLKQSIETQQTTSSVVVSDSIDENLMTHTVESANHLDATTGTTIPDGVIIEYDDSFKLLKYDFNLPDIPDIPDIPSDTTPPSLDEFTGSFIFFDKIYYKLPSEFIKSINEIDDNTIELVLSDGSDSESKVTYKSTDSFKHVAFVYGDKLFIPENRELLVYYPMRLNKRHHIASRVAVYGSPITKFTIVVEFLQFASYPQHWGGLRYTFIQHELRLPLHKITASRDMIINECNRLKQDVLVKVKEQETKLEDDKKTYNMMYNKKLKHLNTY
jgi:hypothetical protein